MDLKKILADHAAWLADSNTGQRANLQGADLQEANLQGADLQRANLQRANLQRADLQGANLQGAYLQRANLQEADLQEANLQGADLQGADLQGAYLPRAPVIPHIDAQILAAIERPGCALEMANWHTCETTHCRAGWAITLAGPAGLLLEDLVGPSTAGALIYAVSRPDEKIPDFLATNSAALADLRAGAAKDPLPV